jgi:xanthine phosphoribosyltransferase
MEARLASGPGYIMHALKERVLREGKDLGNGILKVDGFINHQVDPTLMFDCGSELARLFREAAATKVLTAEISGIGPALLTGYHLGVPVVYARKAKPITMPDQVFLTLSHSHTKGTAVELMVSPEYLSPDDRVLIIDDFLASGATILALIRLARAAGATLVGVGALIEKRFEGGRDALAHEGVPVHALVCVTSMADGRIGLADSADPA